MAPQPQEREVLLALIWPEFDTADARNNLRRELSLLKAALNADVLVADRSQVARNAQVALWLDVEGPDEGPALWDRALAWNVQGLQTDRPAALVDYLRQTGRRQK